MSVLAEGGVKDPSAGSRSLGSPGEAVSESFRKKSKAQGGANLCTPAPDKARRPQKDEGSGGRGVCLILWDTGFVSSRCPTVCSGPLFIWEQPCDPGTSQRPTPPYLFSPVPLLNLLAYIGFIYVLCSTPVPSPCLGLREPSLGKGRRVRAARMEEGPGERKSASDHSSSVCEVTERLPGWSPAFPLESPGLHSRKEAALFTTWPEPSPALSRPRQGLGGAARPGFPLCRASSLRPFQLGL